MLGQPYSSYAGKWRHLSDVSASYHAATVRLVTSFADAGPRVWNDLPTELRKVGQTSKTFCKHLKTALFTHATHSIARSLLRQRV